MHLEQFNKRYNLLHIGITFSNNNENLRYDFRPHSEKKGYITTNRDRENYSNIIPELNNYNPDNKYNLDNEDKIINYINYRDTIIFDTKKISNKDIFWGFTNYTLHEIKEYENKLHKKYRVGIYDCRHYVYYFTKWALNKPTPIWKLHKLWNKSEL